MSNTNMDYLYPEFWASAFDELEVGEYNLQNLVSRNYEATIAEKGETVIVPLQFDFGDADDFTPGSAIGAHNINQEKAEVKLDISKRKTINLTAKELSLSPYELIDTYGVGMVKSLLSTINKEIYKEALKGKYFISDGISSLVEDNIADVGTLLSNNEISAIGRKAVVSPDVMGRLQKRDAFKLVNQTGDDDVMRDGMITRRYGFDFYLNNAISKYTPADVTGATTGAHDVGATTITCGSFADGTTPIRPGDVFKIADQNPDIYYTVISTTVSGNNTNGITFYPGLSTALTAEAPKTITVTPVQSALFMVPSAIAFAARTYGVLPDNTGVRSSVGDYNGLPVRFSVFHDGKLGLTVQADVLCGVKLVNDKRIARVISTLG